MRRIEHWTIKVTWDDSEEEYLYEIPQWIADVVEPYLDGLEQENNEEEE
tara:strand:- start:701 stop:847 length:147 start_codon:yes stop_codon:yes gene_type:complete